ncbi:MAG: DUF4294 domain-containing protein [Paludibacter sp.]
MISLKKSKSHFLAAIGTVLVHILLLGLLNLEFSGEGSSKLSDEDIENLELQMENLTPEDISISPPGKDPLSEQIDKASESVSKGKGVQKAQQEAAPERTVEEQEEQALANPDTIVVPKPEIVLLKKEDSVKQAEKDSTILAQIADLQKPNPKSDASSQRYQKEREKFKFYQQNYKSIRNFKKVYPYALKTREILDNLNTQLATMTNEADKKKLIKETEQKLFKEYEAAVRTMTTSQGRLLLKLIARETNKTGYEIIKDYKGGFSASFWYGVGKLFGTDLKSEFHKEKEDSTIETIIDKYKKNDLY